MARTKSINFPNFQTEYSALFDKLQRSTINCLINAGGLVITGAGGTTAKTVNVIDFMIDGQIFTKAAGNMPALSGTVTNAKFNVFVFSINSSGTITARMGTEAATLGAVVLPVVPDGEVAIGYVRVNPTGTGNFVGGTTALDDATVVPNAIYRDLIGEFYPQYATL